MIYITIINGSEHPNMVQCQVVLMFDDDFDDYQLDHDEDPDEESPCLIGHPYPTTRGVTEAISSFRSQKRETKYILEGPI